MQRYIYIHLGLHPASMYSELFCTEFFLFVFGFNKRSKNIIIILKISMRIANNAYYCPQCHSLLMKCYQRQQQTTSADPQIYWLIFTRKKKKKTFLFSIILQICIHDERKWKLKIRRLFNIAIFNFTFRLKKVKMKRNFFFLCVCVFKKRKNEL